MFSKFYVKILIFSEIRKYLETFIADIQSFIIKFLCSLLPEFQVS